MRGEAGVQAARRMKRPRSRSRIAAALVAGVVAAVFAGCDGDGQPAATAREAAPGIVRELRDTFAADIDDKAVQVRAVEMLLADLEALPPERRDARAAEVLVAAFPGRAPAVMGRYRSMRVYLDWLAAQRDRLTHFSPGDRRREVRDARFRFFGEDAAEIWADEFRHEKVFEALDAIRQLTDMGIADKFTVYRRSIDDAYGGDADAVLAARGEKYLFDFLKLGVVQDDLRRLDASARGDELERMRREMGIGEARRRHWREVDRRGDEDWAVGEPYMLERARILEALDGDEERAAMQELRRRMFGDEADTIRREEEEGIFRFGHRRVMGRE